MSQVFDDDALLALVADRGDQPQPAQRDDDPRFTMGLIFDLLAVLEKHGYKAAPEPRSTARSMVQILHLTEAFEGRDGGR